MACLYNMMEEEEAYVCDKRTFTGNFTILNNFNANIRSAHSKFILARSALMSVLWIGYYVCKLV